MNENIQLKFSDLLYDAIYSQNNNITELIALFSQEIKTQDKIETYTDTLPEAITPGSPVIEFVASKQSQKWSKLAGLLERDGLQMDFSGIVINGRVSLK